MIKSEYILIFLSKIRIFYRNFIYFDTSVNQVFYLLKRLSMHIKIEIDKKCFRFKNSNFQSYRNITLMSHGRKACLIPT